ncbi:uncharacterized protein LOC126911096 [Spodoptera frugiperda]|uniref:Uncharacterized protein LOC126911096 n=1 Tax=Spodoptera frugiperda TaxID=7108 RepID=A0A9R0DSN6_SPOFR|nr:uncharacterized protein LOC126911096 [Spodoptera frugiperda]
MDVMDEESIIRLCATSFLEKEIDAAKNLLFDSISAIKKTTRKGDGKNQRNLEDIITTLKRVDPEKIPIFVARELHRLPPVTFDHIDATRLLKDIVLMQNEIKILKSDRATVEQLDQLRMDLNNIKQTSIVNNFDYNINRKRGGYRNIDIDISGGELDSGPVGLIYNTSKIEEESSECLLRTSNVSSENDVTVKNKESAYMIDQNKTVNQQSEPVSETIQLTPNDESPPPPAPPQRLDNECITVSPHRGITMAEVLRQNNKIQSNKMENSNEWKLVQRPKRKNYFSGKVGNATKDSELNFKAAEKRLPIYITNVHKETSIDDISNYILKKTGEKVNLIKLSIKNENKYNAYKIFVPSYTLRLFLNESMWPKGIVFRRFVHYQYRTADNRPDKISNNK